jgi:hypothetical protein
MCRGDSTGVTLRKNRDTFITLKNNFEYVFVSNRNSLSCLCMLLTRMRAVTTSDFS